MKLTDFDYDLPEHFIAQEPAEPRDSSRLLVLDRATGQLSHRIFRDITSYLRSGDVLVINTTRVIPGRLHALKPTGGKVEILLLRQIDERRWLALCGGRGVRSGVQLTLVNAPITVTVLGEVEQSERVLEFSHPISEVLAVGETPLPPYVHTPLTNPERYQTIYSKEHGSAAAPTAGLHFTPALLQHLQAIGVEVATCVLHIGPDTFQPVRVDRIQDHKMHSERAFLAPDQAEIINRARRNEGRVIAVGTTSARTLETAGILNDEGDPTAPGSNTGSSGNSLVKAFEADTRLFIYPGYRWRVVNGLVTNFHLPKSTLLMMVSSFAGREQILQAYDVAKREQYRFFSFGDAMLIL